MRRVVRRVPATLIAMLAVAGCSFGGGGDIPPSSAPPVDENLAAQARLVAAQYVGLGSAHPDWVVVDDAITTLINQCLREQGLTFQQKLPSTQRGPGDNVAIDILRVLLADADDYGLAAYLQVQQQVLAGGGVTEPVVPPGERELIAVALWGDDSAPRVQIEEEDGTINSFPTTGCQAEAQEAVYGVPVGEYERTRLGLPSISEVVGTVSSDPDVTALEVAWSRCMSASGYRNLGGLTDLYELTYETYVQHAERSDGVTQLASWEAEIASADSACRIDTGFGNAVNASFVSHGERILQDHEDVFVVAQEIEATALENAARVLSEG